MDPERRHLDQEILQRLTAIETQLKTMPCGDHVHQLARIEKRLRVVENRQSYWTGMMVLIGGGVLAVAQIIEYVVIKIWKR